MSTEQTTIICDGCGRVLPIPQPVPADFYTKPGQRRHGWAAAMTTENTNAPALSAAELDELDAAYDIGQPLVLWPRVGAKLLAMARRTLEAEATRADIEIAYNIVRESGDSIFADCKAAAETCGVPWSPSPHAWPRLAATEIVALRARVAELEASERAQGLMLARGREVAASLNRRAQLAHRREGAVYAQCAGEIVAALLATPEEPARPRALEPWELHASLEVIELLRDVAAKGECSAACADEHDPECRPHRATSILAALDARPPPEEPAPTSAKERA